MRYIFLLLLCPAIINSASDFESSAKAKSKQYEKFLQAMKMMDDAEHVIVIKPRNMQIPPLIIEDEEERNEYIVLSKEDFEPSIKADTRE